MTPLIRPAVADDHAQLCELFDELDQLHRDARPDIFRKPAGDARSRADMAGLMGGDGGTILVADGGNGLVGVAVALLRSPSHPLLVARKTVEIDNVVVRRTHRRQGIGRLLVAACVEWAKERGADDVEVAVHDFNAAAAAFYAALGFEPSVHRLRRRLP